jgi:hypothetical protein
MNRKKSVRITLSNNIRTDIKLIKIDNVIFEEIYLMQFSESHNYSYTWLDKYINDICVKDFDITKYKTFYRYPKINLSRDKMETVKTKYKVKKVLDINKADFKIIGTKSLESLMQSDWRQSLSSPLKLRSILAKYTSVISDEVMQKIDLAFKDLDDDDTIILNCNSRTYGGYDNTIIEKLIGEIDGLSYGSASIVVGKKNMEDFDHLYSTDLVSDTTMNELSSEDSVILDDQSYGSIRAMLKGSNSQDHAIAMSMMSNCNVAKSKTYLGLLFFHFSETLRTAPLWNQVAFKTIKEQFNKYVLEHNHYHSNRYSQLIKYLAEDNALTSNASKHIVSMVFDKVINGSTGMNDNNSVFTIDKSAIKIVDNYSTLIK